MGSAKRLRPARLSEKLKAIRDGLDLTQEKLVEMLKGEDAIDRRDISKYETDEREPPLRVLLKYARLAGTSTDVLIDDELDLPKKRSTTH